MAASGSAARKDRAPRKPKAPKPTAAAKRAKKAVKARQPATRAKPAPAPRAPAPPRTAAGAAVRPAKPAVPPRDVAEDSPAAWIHEPEPAATPGQLSPAEPARAWIPVPPAAKPGFDPATGAWLPVGPTAAAPAEPAPDAPKKGVGYVLWTILLWIDLAALAFATVAAILTGAVLLFAPDSEGADRIREQLEGGTAGDIVLNTVLGFVAFGVIPFLWVYGTRLVPGEGTKRFLHLHWHRHGKGSGAAAATLLWGVVLALGMLLAVTVLITVYTLATEGSDGFASEDKPNPAVQGILEHLTWPLAILIALGAGIGEEVFFRGFLQRHVGVWGQAALFGLAHATGGYLPQILFAFGLGVVFGFLLKRGWSLWTLIVAHVLYDFVLLGLALLYPELG